MAASRLTCSSRSGSSSASSLFASATATASASGLRRSMSRSAISSLHLSRPSSSAWTSPSRPQRIPVKKTSPTKLYATTSALPANGIPSSSPSSNIYSSPSSLSQSPLELKPTSPAAYTDANTYDIVIIGGGNAGLALACGIISQPTLSTTLRKVLLIEGSPSLTRVRQWAPAEGEDWDNRVSSLTAENVQWLRDIGAWQHIEPERPCPVHDMKVWTSIKSDSSSQIQFSELSTPMAYMTENINLQRALLRQIEASATTPNNPGRVSVTISEGAKVSEMVMGEGERWVGLHLGEGETAHWVRGSVVVGADGPNSPVRKFSEIESFGHAYPTHGVVCTMHHPATTATRMRNNTAFQRFLPTGPLAFLPLSPEYSTMVWSTRPALAAAYTALGPTTLRYLVNLGFYAPDESTINRINEMILAGQLPPGGETEELLKAELDYVLTHTPASELKQLPPLIDRIQGNSIASFPLKLSHAESYIGKRTVLVGDAAHTVHPLAGQGLNMGLADVRSLTRVWENAAERGGDFGSSTALLPYATERYPANHLLLSTTDKLHHIFGTRIPVVNWARSVGLDVINELGPLKQALMGQVGADVDRKKSGGVGGGLYESAANGLEAWQSAKMVGRLAVDSGKALVKNGARQLLERLSR